MWYGMAVGLTYNEALTIPFGELLDYIAIEQIKREGSKLRQVLTDDEIIPDVR